MRSVHFALVCLAACRSPEEGDGAAEEDSSTTDDAQGPSPAEETGARSPSETDPAESGDSASDSSGDASAESSTGADTGSGGPSDDDELHEVASFTSTAQSQASWGECLEAELPVLGYSPTDADGPFPLFIWIVGTFAHHDSEDVHLTLEEMAKRGFVAVSPAYDNFIINGCSNLHEKTMCIFDAERPASLVARMCARPDVDCERGIVIGGHSQGAQISLTARSYEPRVQAVYAMSPTCDYLLDQSDGLCNPGGTSCLLSSNLDLPADRLRIMTGESDDYSTELDYARMSGVTCPSGTLDCLAADGSGWYRVPDAAVDDGLADHCYIVNSTDGAWCPGIDAAHPFDDDWAPPSRSTWSLITNLEWLADFAR